MRNVIQLHDRYSFRLKLAGAVGLALLADLLFFQKEPGSTLGVFALAWTVAVALCVPGVRRNKPAMIAQACAACLSMALFDRPGPLTAMLFWIALSSSVVLAQTKFQDALLLCLRLAMQGVMGLGKTFGDGIHVLRLKRPDLRGSLRTGVAALALPLVGGSIFIALFAAANPVIERFMPDLSFFALDRNVFLHAWFCGLVLVLVWPTMRPSRLAVVMKFQAARRQLNLPGVTSASITISLLLFNVIFAVQNGLDVAFLWSGAPLPDGVTLADYAHRGAYPLIATALLAGAFVLMTANPDSEIGRRPLIRRLVVIWIAQNLILVASSIIRTIDYIDAYMMTQLRLAALLWMGLVATGLALICWRMVMRHSLGWLINRTALAATLVLGFACVVDLGTVAAEWNIRHARETGGGGQPLDLVYLRSLGSSALVPLAQLETRPLDGGFLDRVAFVRQDIVAGIQHQQDQAYGWIWRDARRLDTAKEILGPSPRVPAPVPDEPYPARPLTDSY